MIPVLAGCLLGKDPMYGYTMNKEAVSDRLRRIEGQVRGTQRQDDSTRS